MNLDNLKAVARRLGRRLVEYGELKREYEVTRVSYSNRNSIILFKVSGLDNVVLYSNLFTTRRDIVSLLGLPTVEDAYYAIKKAQQKTPVLEYVDFSERFVEAEVDLSKLPFLKYYREDGGYYLTSSIYIACYEEICNSSYHRTMYLGKNKAVLRIVPRHLHYILAKYFERGKDAPVAMVLGLDSYHEIAAATSPPLGVFEVRVGANLGGDHRVVKTPKYGIPVPASASIVVEGVISRDERAFEGSFVDVLMLVDEVREQPVFVAENVYFSKDQPVLVHAIVPGLWEHQLLMGFPREAEIYVELKRVVPCVKAVRLTEGGSSWLHGIISVSRECSEGDAKLAALVAISAHPSIKHVVVVDEDIDVDDPFMVEWAIATRMKGGSDIEVLRDVRGSTLEPRGKGGIGDKVIVLAIAPRSEPYEKYRRVGIP